MGFERWKPGIQPIGVDVGTSGVRLLQLRRLGSRWEVVAAARSPLPEPYSQIKPQSRQRVITQAIAAARRSAPFRGKVCCSAPCSSELMIRAVRLPRMGDAELGQAVIWEAAERFDLGVDELQTEWLRAGQVVPGDETRDEIILVSIKRDAVVEHIESILQSGLRPVAVDTTFTADARAVTHRLRRKADRQKVRMILDIGAGNTIVMIARGHRIAFVKPIEIGGNAMTQAISDAVKLESAAVSRLRSERLSGTSEENGNVTPTRVDRTVFKAVRPLLHELAEEASLCLRYYSVTFRGARPERVYVGGGDALEPGLVDILQEHLKIESEVVRPFRGIDLPGSVFPNADLQESSPEWTTAVGLSLRRYAENEWRLNDPIPGPEIPEAKRGAA